MFVNIIDRVRLAFRDRGFDGIVIDEGPDARNAQTNFGAGGSMRVVFAPSAEPFGFAAPTSIGEGAADELGESRRALMQTAFVFDVVIAAVSPKARFVEHQRRCFDIFEIVVQEVHRAYYGQAQWTSARWNLDRKVGAFGAELVATLAINIPIFDAPCVVKTPTGVLANPEEKAA